MTKNSTKPNLADVKDLSTLQVTTLGRKTGKRHTVTAWFLVDGELIYLVTLNLKQDWIRNLKKNGTVKLKIGGDVFNGHAKPVLDSKRLEHVKRLLAQKYWAAWAGSWLGLGPEGAFEVKV